MFHKPVLQAVVLADHVYVDAQSGKKIIAGTFNELQASEFPSQFPRSTFAYLCLTDLRTRTTLDLRYVDLETGEVLMQLDQIPVSATSPLDSAELIVEVPEFPMPRPGAYAMEVICCNEILGFLRVNVRKADENEDVGSEGVEDHFGEE